MERKNYTEVLINGNIYTLGGSEEQEYLQRYAKGDQEARDILIERNLRLVAHIINNG